MHPVTGETRNHDGIDLAVPIGTPVRAAGAGTVSKVRLDRDSAGGLAVSLAHTPHIATYYAHLSQPIVRVGQHVSAGEIIGYSGDTGRVTGAHLHFGVYVDGVPVDPLPYLPPGSVQ